MSYFDELFRDAFPLLQDVTGELITYTPVGGGPALEIVALAWHEIELRPAQMQAGEDRELVAVTVKRTYPDTTPDGIETPQRGDRIHRDENGDPDGKVYEFTGKILGSSSVQWTLEFEAVIA